MVFGPLDSHGNKHFYYILSNMASTLTKVNIVSALDHSGLFVFIRKYKNL